MKLKKIIAFLISVLPLNSIRVFLYRKCLRYKIRKSHIGWNTIISVESAEIIECTICRNNQFIGPMKLNVKKGVFIRRNNLFECGEWAKNINASNVSYKKYFEIGEGSRISSNNFFDIAGSLVIGSNSWIAGRDSQFWTHGAGVTDRDIEIGDNCYVGSSVRFAPGASIGNNAIVALGSIVTKKHSKDYIFLGGNPARIIKESYDWRKKVISN